MSIKQVTKEEMVEIDRRMVEEFRIDIIMTMENAGKSLAILAREILGKDAYGKKITILVGKGNNGGGGLVAARHLHNWGANVDVILAFREEELKEAPLRQLEILSRIGLPLIHEFQQSLEGYDLHIDALLGYNSNQSPREPIATIIRNANASGVRILALDVPSGIDSTSGFPHKPTIRASTTLCLGVPKKGLTTRQARPYVGSLYLADISIPRAIYSRLGIDLTSIFCKTFISRINY